MDNTKATTLMTRSTDQPASLTHAEYISEITSWKRSDILKTLRAGRVTAHRLATNEQLAELCWRLFGRDANQ